MASLFGKWGTEYNDSLPVLPDPEQWQIKCEIRTTLRDDHRFIDPLVVPKTLVAQVENLPKVHPRFQGEASIYPGIPTTISCSMKALFLTSESSDLLIVLSSPSEHLSVLSCSTYAKSVTVDAHANLSKGHYLYAMVDNRQ